MIKQINIRQFKDGGEQFTDIFERPLDKCLYGLIKYELGFGGIVASAQPTRLVVNTPILGHIIDTVIYEGPEDEMKHLLTIAYYYTVAANHEDQQEIVGKAQQIAEGNALFTTMVLPLLMGCSRLKVAVILSMGVDDEAEIKRFKSLNLEDLITILMLSQETKEDP